MIIFAYQDDFGWLSTGNELNPIKLELNGEDDTRDIVEKISHIWRNNPGNIDCLFLCAHGNSGFLNLGDGITIVEAQYFARLRGMFSAKSRGIEIHGCGCASPTVLKGNIAYTWQEGTISRNSGKGFEFVKKIAVSSGVKTTAPFQTIGGYRAAYAYIGVDTLTVKPNGSSYIRMRDGNTIDERGVSGSW